MNNDFGSRVQNVIRTHLKNIEDDDPLPIDVKLVELGLDSLGAVNLVLDLEDTFDIEFPDAMLTEATFDTARSLCDSLRELVSTKAS
jgi:acyl carrier protein